MIGVVLCLFATGCNLGPKPLIAITLVTIQSASDSFVMGDSSYGPNVSQTLSPSYAISKYEITNAQFAQFTSDGGYKDSTYWTANGWQQKTANGWTSALIRITIHFAWLSPLSRSSVRRPGKSPARQQGV